MGKTPKTAPDVLALRRRCRRLEREARDLRQRLRLVEAALTAAGFVLGPSGEPTVPTRRQLPLFSESSPSGDTIGG